MGFRGYMYLPIAPRARLFSMTSSDWFYIAINFLWIFGLSTILATFSYQMWLYQEARRPLPLVFGERALRLALAAGLFLVALAVAFTPRSERWWMRLTALAFAMVLAWVGAETWRRDDRVD